MASDNPNMDNEAIKNRLAEANAVLFDDRTFTRRRTVGDGMRLKYRAASGEDLYVAGVNPYKKTGNVEYARYTDTNGVVHEVTIGQDLIDPDGNTYKMVKSGEMKFKRSVRILVRQWTRIPDREREPLYEFLRTYASVKNTSSTCWIEEPMIDGETLAGFWRMLRHWESRYRPDNVAEQGVFQTLMQKGPWEIDNVPEGAGDGDDNDGDAGECIASSPLHHIDREVQISGTEVPSCDHQNDRGHIYEASGSFNEEDGTWSGHIDDDIARDPGDFVTWSGARFSKRKVIGGTHKWNTALPDKAALEARINDLSTEMNYFGNEYPYRDIFGRPRTSNKECPPGYVEEDFSPWWYFKKHGYPNVMNLQGKDDIKNGAPVTGMGVTIEASADLDNYGLFSTREHQHVTENRRFYMRDGGHIHDAWTYRSYKSAWLPVQNIDAGQTLQMTADMDEDGMFNFTKVITFAHEWTAWHAKKDEDSISVVFEFHNRKTHDAPARSTAQSNGLEVLVAKFGYQIETNRLITGKTIVSMDYDKNEYGLYDGKVSYVIPFESVNMGTTATRNKFGQTSRIHTWRNVPENSFAEGDSRGYVLRRTGKSDIVYATPGAGKTLSFRKRLNDFGLFNITIQENDSYPEGFREVYKYTTRKGRFQRNRTIIVDGKEISETKGYCYWADVQVKTFASEAEANAFVTANNTSEANILRNSNGKWNDGSSVSYEGNGVWVGRKVIHHYSSNVQNIEVPR